MTCHMSVCLCTYRLVPWLGRSGFGPKLGSVRLLAIRLYDCLCTYRLVTRLGRSGFGPNIGSVRLFAPVCLSVCLCTYPLVPRLGTSGFGPNTGSVRLLSQTASIFPASPAYFLLPRLSLNKYLPFYIK